MSDEKLIELAKIISNSIESNEKRDEAIRELGELAEKDEMAFNALFKLADTPICDNDKKKIISIIINIMGEKVIKLKKKEEEKKAVLFI